MRCGSAYDVAVVGAGIVGVATALALARAGWRVALVERAVPARTVGRLGVDLRTVALAPPSLDFLAQAAGRQRQALAPLGAIREMHIWEHDGSASLRFAPGPGREADALAWVVENSALTECLWQASDGLVARLAPADVSGLTVGEDAVRLDGTDIEARLVVAADGASSAVAGFAGGRRRQAPGRWLLTPGPSFHSRRRRRPGGDAPETRAESRSADEQIAIATAVASRRPHAGTAWQRFGASGPLALLPCAQERTLSMIWSVSRCEGQHLLSLSDAAFAAALEAETESALGGFEAVDRRVSFPLRQSLAENLNPLPRVILAGDAARSLHPLAGQGVNLGLEDARAIVAAAGAPNSAARLDLGAAGRWRAYARTRRVRSKTMLLLMNALLAAYCGRHASSPWLRLARNSTIRWIDASPGAKAQLVREAMGLGPLAALEAP